MNAFAFLLGIVVMGIIWATRSKPKQLQFSLKAYHGPADGETRYNESGSTGPISGGPVVNDTTDYLANFGIEQTENPDAADLIFRWSRSTTQLDSFNRFIPPKLLVSYDYEVRLPSGVKIASGDLLSEWEHWYPGKDPKQLHRALRNLIGGLPSALIWALNNEKSIAKVS